ncbi:vesicular glutamate transporter 1-like [Phlebotomus argentipes]|uniref:vesicular glutamate transporter 1-like n=1 Tax=Phlebotomus argentipes TaxID=94469 RepID=UPI002892A351|nr:vesicular glutamate transporter 1-like [Phlebotomus argentipes]
MKLKFYFDLLRAFLWGFRKRRLAIENSVIDDVSIWKRKRYLVFLLLSLGFMCVAFMKICLAVAIVEMAGDDHDFDWDTRKQGFVISTFLYGYITSQLLGGLACRKFSPIHIFSTGVGVAGLLAILLPSVAELGYEWVMVLRIVQGFMLGTSYPVLLTLITRWALMHERARLISLALFGMYTGGVLSLPVSGALIAAFGWRSVFTVSGSCGLIWALVFVSVVKAGPEVDVLITEREKMFILQQLEGITPKQHVIPWKGIFTSSGVWAIAAMAFAQMWGSSTYLAQLPRFLKDVMHLSIDEAAFLSACPFLFTCISMLVSGFIVDLVIQKRFFTAHQTRRLFTLFAYVLQTTLVVTSIHLPDKISFIVVLTLGVIWEPLAIACFTVNIVDLCPVSAPIILSLTSTVSSIAGILTPIAVGFLAQNKTLKEWQTIFYIIGTFYIAAATIYWIFSKSDIQPWSPVKNRPENNQNTQNTETP